MTIARRSQICLSSTRYYHCVSRCVRRAFLCGRDRETGRSFEHRKHWIERRMHHLASIFAVDICAYSVMDNHYHMVLHVDNNRAGAWSNDEVIRRWYKLFRGTSLANRHLDGESLSAAERNVLDEIVRIWRTRLCDLSWFMRCINEPIARRANQEDGCKGRFWEGRFKCQALLDEGALLACMAYVDLNPIRAGIATTLEGSMFTSVAARLSTGTDMTWRRPAPELPHNKAKSAGMTVFMDPKEPELPYAIPVTATEYLQLLDFTGRAIRDGKFGYIPDYVRPICHRLHLEPTEWTQAVRYFGSRFNRVAGAVERLRLFAKAMGRRWLKGQANCQRLFRADSL